MKWIALVLSTALHMSAASQEYFPKSMFVMKDCYEKEKDNVYKLEDYSGRLQLLKQPSLYRNDAQHSIYRFLWIPSLDTLMVITLHMKRDKSWIEWSKGFHEDVNKDGMLGDWINLSILNNSEKIKYDSLEKQGASAEAINNFFDRKVVTKENPPWRIISGAHQLLDLDSASMNYIIKDLGFWKDHSMGPCALRMGFMDGSEWLFEVRQGKQYKCVSRSNPGSDSKYYLLGVLFLKAAKINKELVDIY